MWFITVTAAASCCVLVGLEECLSLVQCFVVWVELFHVSPPPGEGHSSSSTATATGRGAAAAAQPLQPLPLGEEQQQQLEREDSDSDSSREKSGPILSVLVCVCSTCGGGCGLRGAATSSVLCLAGLVCDVICD